MFQNYLKSSIRSLLKNKVYATVNICGLAIGLAGFLLILQYVFFETSYDSFHKNKDDIYRVATDRYQQDKLIESLAVTYSPMAPALISELSGIRDYARLFKTNGTILHERTPGDWSVFTEEEVFYADPSFLSVFTITKADGSGPVDPVKLAQANKAIISKTLASKYFGDNAVGQILTYYSKDYGKVLYEVTGVFGDVPTNSHVNFQLLLSYPTLTNLESTSMIPLEQNWGWPGFYTYLLLDDGVDPQNIASKISSVSNKFIGENLKRNNEREDYYLQPVTSIHLKSDLLYEAGINNKMYIVNFLVIIAILTLLIAYSNYINLSVAHAGKRSKEIGVRKVMGAERSGLARQFLMEALVMNCVAMILTIAIIFLSLPFLSGLTGKPLEVVFKGDIRLWLVIPAVVLVGTILSGLSPALVLSSYSPTAILRGKVATTQFRKFALGKFLVLMQFAISISLIGGSIAVYKQLQYMQDHDLGFNSDHKLIVRAPSIMEEKEGVSTSSVFDAFGNLLKSNSSITDVSYSTAIPGHKVSNTTSFKRRGQSREESKLINIIGVDYDFLRVYGVPVVAGRAYSREFGVDESNGTMILNETAAELLGFDSPEAAIGKQIDFPFDPTRTVIGVIKDYNQESLQHDNSPFIYLLNQKKPAYFTVVVNSGENGLSGISQTVSSIEEAYKSTFPENAFEYFFLEDYFNRQYMMESKFSKVFFLFAGMAIFVACLGLLALSIFTVSNRLKEIAIRKVFGASPVRIFVMLAANLLSVVVLANFIALPILYYVLKNWLQNFSFRMNLAADLFVMPGIIVLLIALVTIGVNIIRAATTDQIRNLRSE